MNNHLAPHNETKDLYTLKLDPWSSHSIIKDLLASYPAGTRILDVGTASGTIGKLCQGRGFILHGIEPMKEWAETSLAYYEKLSQTDLQHTDDAFLKDHQVVICADVLEHMPDPCEQLSQLVQLQPSRTLFVISVPNIANLYIRFHLFLGKFDYADRGILDKTHLRFFTRRTIIELLRSCNLEIIKINPTPIPLNLITPFFHQNIFGRWIHGMLAWLTRCFPTLLGYQFVIFAVKQ